MSQFVQLSEALYSNLNGNIRFSFAIEAYEGYGLFVHEMICRHLQPFGTLEVFSFASKREGALTVIDAEVSYVPEHVLDVFCEELRLGARSKFYAMKILEIKGLALRDKLAFVLDGLRQYIRRFPARFDYDMLPLLQRFFIHMSEPFREMRSSGFLMRKVLGMYWMSRQGGGCVKARVRKERVSQLFGDVDVLDVMLVMPLLGPSKRFSFAHVKKAIAAISPETEVNEESYYEEKDRVQGVQLFSFELEGCRVRPQLLERLLPKEAQKAVETVVQRLRIPRNEEAVMKQMILLSGQLSQKKDIPQVIISFDEQTEDGLVFSVIMARNDVALGIDLLAQPHPAVSLERMRVMPKKELSALSVRVSAGSGFIAARKEVLTIVESLVGQVRDYYGGIYEKEERQLAEVASLVESSSGLQEWYASLQPGEYKSTLPTDVIAAAFSLYKRVRTTGEGGYVKVRSFYCYASPSFEPIEKEASKRFFTWDEEEICGYITDASDGVAIKSLQKSFREKIRFGRLRHDQTKAHRN